MHYTPAIVGVVLVAMLVAVTLANHKRDAERAYASAKQQYENTKGIVPAAPTQRAQSDPKSYRDEWRSEQDLEAQRQMAEWAFLMLLATSVGVIITGAGVTFVALTLTEMREATKHAASAAESTAEAVRVAQQDSRAWLMVDNAVANVTDIEGGYLHMDINLKCENVGRTVATDVAIQGFAVTLSVKEYAARNFSREVKRIEDAGRIDDLPLKTIIAPTRAELLYTLTRSEIDVSEAEPVRPKVGKMIVVLFIAVSYRGIGNSRGTTTRAFKADLHVYQNEQLRHLGGAEPDHPRFESADHIHHWMQ